MKTLIRLAGCPGWSESSLGAHAMLLVLSQCGSIFIFLYEITLWVRVSEIELPQHTFLQRTEESYHLIIIKYPSSLFKEIQGWYWNKELCDLFSKSLIGDLWILMYVNVERWQKVASFCWKILSKDLRILKFFDNAKFTWIFFFWSEIRTTIHVVWPLIQVIVAAYMW